MKLWLISDLHLDFGGQRPRPPADADIAVVAGDVCDDRWLEETADLLPVVFVAGNHEFYGHTYQERIAELRRIPEVTLLDNSEATIGGVRFVGCTLWTDYDGADAAAMQFARYGMNDHRRIRWGEQWERFDPRHALNLHRQSVGFLRGSLCDNNPPDVPTVVVTHHAPSLKSIHPKFQDAGALNYAFASELYYLVEGSGAELWVHGHVHDPFDYRIGETRVVCNPIGYPHEAGNGAMRDLIVEVGA